MPVCFETAHEAVKNMTAGWNLGNSLDSCGKITEPYTVEKYETSWENPVTTPKMTAAVKNAGFNALRLPVTWDRHIDEHGNIDPAWLDRVYEIAHYALDSDMYCIINVHHDSGPIGWLFADKDNFEKNKAKFAGLWKNIAEKFRDCGQKLLFEAFNEMLDTDRTWNEPSSPEAYDVINSYNKLFVDTVRATGGNNAVRNLSVQTYSASSENNVLDGFVMPENSGHIIVQVHNYDPQGFCWIHSEDKVLTDKWGSAEDKREIDILVQKLGDFSRKIGAPVIIGEYGTEDKKNDAARAAHGKYFTGKTAEQGIKCFWWDTGHFSLLDRHKSEMIHPDIVASLTKNS